MATLVILGAGMMGTALAWPLADRGHAVRLVGTPLDAAIIDSLRRSGVHPKLGLEVPGAVTAYPDAELDQALQGADAVALGVSSAGVRWAAERLRGRLPEGVPLAMVSKGLAWDGTSLAVLPDRFARVFAAEGAGAIEPVGIAGPCIAGELARRVATSVVFTSRSARLAEAWAALARGPYYHVWTEADVVGVEVCAALKNAYAMGMAFAAGIHARSGGESGSIALHNYEASVFAQAVWEMRGLIGLLGGDPEQASWLPGVGDLDVTCNGGRTGRFGHLLGLGIGRDQAVEQMQGATLECLEILSTLRRALKAFVASGRIGAGAFPLAEHLAAVALDGDAIEMPFERFFKRYSTLKRSE